MGLKKKKIGLLTFHTVYNYGAVLQCMALTSYLNEYCGECEVIDYHPNGEEKSSILKEIIYILLKCIRQRSLDSMNYRYRFYKFKSKNLKISKEHFWGDKEIYTQPPKYDWYISGSDQLFNMSLSNDSNAYFLGFTDSKNKLSYASSFGRLEISDTEKKLVENELSRFRYVSVREDKSIDIIKAIAGINASFVLDPVYLFEKKEWEKYCSKTRVESKYVLLYLMEDSSSAYEIAKKIASEHNYQIIDISNVMREHNHIKHISNAGPGEFLTYINNAEWVITNSFHGMSFSIIFGKQFIPIAHSKLSVRLQTIADLTGFNLVNPNTNQVEYAQYIVDGKQVHSKLSPVIKQSKEYLKIAFAEDRVE